MPVSILTSAGSRAQLGADSWVIALPLNTEIRQILIYREIKPASDLSVSCLSHLQVRHSFSLLWEVTPQTFPVSQCLGNDVINKEKKFNINLS